MLANLGHFLAIFPIASSRVIGGKWRESMYRNAYNSSLIWLESSVTHGLAPVPGGFGGLLV
jgi:hypothetical protein